MKTPARAAALLWSSALAVSAQQLRFGNVLTVPNTGEPAAFVQAEAVRFLTTVSECFVAPPRCASLSDYRYSEDGKAPTMLSDYRYHPAAGTGPELLELTPIIGSIASCTATLVARRSDEGSSPRHTLTAACRAALVGARASITSGPLLCGSVPACAAAAPPRAEVHTLLVSSGLTEADVGVVRHTWLPAASDHAAAAAAAAAAASPAAAARIRIMSFNTWNVNPGRGLFRSAEERWRAYNFRMMHLGDVLRRGSPDIVALQEVRYDSTLGGRDAPGTPQPPPPQPGSRSWHPPTFSSSLELAHNWHNQTVAIGAHPKYVERNQRHWDAVLGAERYAAASAGHPYESREPHADADAHLESRGRSSSRCTEGAAANATPDAGATASATATEAGDAPAPAPPQTQAPPHTSPYARNWPRGPASYAAVRDAAARHPHAQIEHIAAQLGPGGYQFVYAPAQLYLDPSRWLLEGEPHIDAEGPAIFSRWPIVHSDYLLLSRDAADGDDGHQRLCLHAVIDASASLVAATGEEGAGTGGEGAVEERGGPPLPRLLLDVYTVHLALSERARNRTVPELREFVRRTARGAAYVLTGDMNAEPQEPAMRWLVDPALPAEEALLVAPIGGAAEAEAPARAASADAAAGAGVSARVAAGMRDLDDLGRRCSSDGDAPSAGGDVEVGADGSQLPLQQRPRLAAESGSATGCGAAGAEALLPPPVFAASPGAQPSLADAFTLLHGPESEPAPRSSDAAVRRYVFTFPSDDPAKRIDLVLMGALGNASTAADGGGSLAAVPWLVSPSRLFLLGQDGMPGTDAYEGRGVGMSSERSPIYASDHRAVVADLSVRGRGAR